MNVGHFNTRYHGQGIASAMLDELKAWARARGWRRIETLSCPDVVPFWALGPQHLRRSPLERRGFCVVSETTVPPDQVEFRRAAIRRIRTGQYGEEDWDFKTYPYNLEQVARVAAASDWESACAKDYVMAYDL
jgi:hypothetical protein